VGNKKDGEKNKQENKDEIFVSDKGQEYFGDWTKPTEGGLSQAGRQSGQQHVRELQRSASMPTVVGGKFEIIWLIN
jgi:hypothetical protein